MTYDDLVRIVRFMKAERVQNFIVDDLEVHFSHLAFNDEKNFDFERDNSELLPDDEREDYPF